MEKICRAMMNLISGEIFGKVYGDKICLEEIKAFRDDELKALYRLSKAHDLAHIVGDALIKNNLIADETIKNKFELQIFTAVYRYENINYEFKKIKQTLENAKIPFIPLKGAVIRKFYPEPWMRTSCDIDILVHEEELEKAITALTDTKEYTTDGKRHFHDVSLYSATGMHLELHFNIKETIDKSDNVLCRAWEFAEKQNGYEYAFTNEFLLYHIYAHASYHFQSGGCGIRPFIDIFLLLKALPRDNEKLGALLEESGIKKFSKEAEALAKVWFESELHTEITQKMEDYVLQGGVYGTLEQQIAVSQSKNGGKTKYLLSRIFLSYKQMKSYYPSLKKCPALFPFYQVRRWCRIIFCGGRKRVMKEVKISQSISNEKQQSIQALFDDLEL